MPYSSTVLAQSAGSILAQSPSLFGPPRVNTYPLTSPRVAEKLRRDAVLRFTNDEELDAIERELRRDLSGGRSLTWDVSRRDREHRLQFALGDGPARASHALGLDCPRGNGVLPQLAQLPSEKAIAAQDLATAEAALRQSTEPVEAAPEASGTPSRTFPEVSKEVQSKFHSMIRWAKSSEEITSYMEENPGVEQSRDPQNGNYVLHIAVQNGHHMLTKQIVARGVDLNVQNGSGHTPLHMARGYDLYWLARFLLENGARPDIKNNGGYTGETGMDGDKRPDDGMAALSDASSTHELLEALKLLKAQESLDKAVLVQTGMSKKRSAKAIWSADVAAGFQEIVRNL